MTISPVKHEVLVGVKSDRKWTILVEGDFHSFLVTVRIDPSVVTNSSHNITRRKPAGFPLVGRSYTMF